MRATNPCVTADTLVSTKLGLQKIGDMWDTQEDVMPAMDGRMDPEAFRCGSAVKASGTKQVYRLTTHEGYEVRLTADHKVMTERGWVRAADLKESDQIHIMNRMGGFGDIGDAKLGKTLGWLVGDGTLYGQRAVLPFFGEKQELATEFAEMVEVCVAGPGGNGRPISALKVKGRDETRVESMRFYKVAAAHGLTPGHKRAVPETVLCGTKGMQAGFLQALFSSDGHVNCVPGNGVTVELTSISYGMLQDVQRLLVNFGIASRIYRNRWDKQVKMMPDGRGGKKPYACKAGHQLNISKDNMTRFQKEIGFLLKPKRDKLAAGLAAYKNKPHEEKFVAKFVELVPEGEEQVFDITEPNTHSFVANGIIVSNCSEQSMYPYESCNLGSINLSNMIKGGKFDWERYEAVIRVCTRFLDCIIDVTNYPIPEIEKASIESRRTGLGVMGVADLLYKLGIPYNSKKGYELQDRLAEALSYYSMDESVELAKERGAFQLCSKSEYPDGKIPIAGYYEKTARHDWVDLIERIKEYGIRNVLTTTIAPTGSLAMIAECSNGMEPVFAISYEKRVAVGKFVYTNNIVRRILEEEGVYSDELSQKIADNGGSLRGIAEIPAKYRNLFVTAMDIHWADHVMAQAVWQNWIGNAISKTINMPHDAPPESVKSAYLLAHELGVKGITVYRDGSRHAQVLHKSGGNDDSCAVPVMPPSKHVMEYVANGISNPYVRENLSGLSGTVTLHVEKPHRKPVIPDRQERDICPNCKSRLTFAEGCAICVNCGYTGCSS